MIERPMIFNSEMIRSILDNLKTQTRRPIKGDFVVEHGEVYRQKGRPSKYLADGTIKAKCPYGKVGDKLWVKETFGCFDRASAMPIESDEIVYRADKCDHPDGIFSGWRPSIHMPRWASRITLEITDVRVERVQDITNDDAAKEGVISRYDGLSYRPPGNPNSGCADVFLDLWDSIYGKTEYKWSNNCWVWCLEFKVLDK